MEAGLTAMRDAGRCKRLRASLEGYLSLLFQGNILPVTRAIAARWGNLDGLRPDYRAALERAGWNDCRNGP